MKTRSFCLALAVAMEAATHFASAQSWTQTGAPITNWQDVAVSADGSKLIAVSGGQIIRGLIYTSTNSGTNWTPTTAPPTNWICVACSADGNSIAAGIFLPSVNIGVGVYESADFGADWSSNNFGRCEAIASSADGTRLAAVGFAAGVLLSTNSGTSWHTNTTGVSDLARIASSADGSRLVVGNNVGTILVSTNGGSNWTTTTSLRGGVTSLAASTDGLKVVAVAEASPDPRVYLSTDGGNNWESNTVPARSDWFSCASSADGSKLAALGQKGVIYTSADSGETWASNNVPALGWQAAAFSADGSQLLAASTNGGIWILQTTPSPQLNLASADGNLAFSWLVPALNFVLQQNTDLTTTDWTPLTNVPVLNLTNLQYQLTLPPTGSNTFYRLAAP